MECTKTTVQSHVTCSLHRSFVQHFLSSLLGKTNPKYLARLPYRKLKYTINRSTNIMNINDREPTHILTRTMWKNNNHSLYLYGF